MLYALATGLLLAAEEGEEPEGIDLLLPETSELIAGAIAFAIIFIVAWKFVFPALNKALEARQQAVTSRLSDAEASKLEAEKLLEDYKAQLADARAEGDRIVEEARQTAEAMKADIVGKANAEAEEIRRKAHADATSERSRAEAELRREVASLSLDVAERVVGAGLDRDAQAALVDRYIYELQGIS